jgi:hypothetical protein
MNYNVMKRPMFKMGGKANSQGTGITSGLDEKVDMTEGRANYANGPDLSSMTSKDFLQRALSKIDQREQAIAGMDDMINLQALGGFSQLAGDITTNNPLEAALQLVRGAPAVTLPALSAKKKLELQKLDPKTDLALAKALKKDRPGAQKVYEMKKADLKRINADLYDVEQKLINETDEAKIKELMKNKFILQEEKNLVYSTFETDEELRSRLLLSAASSGYPISDREIDDIIKRIRNKGNAEGGMPNRVDRAMGTPMMGEQPMSQDIGLSQTTKQDVAMETKGQGNNVYAMLRARLPQEVSDEVVKLIAYNKEAFADFASIKNQEDVSSFNDKYGVQLVIDVATV